VAQPILAVRLGGLPFQLSTVKLSTAAWENRISNMNRPRNFRVYFLLAALALGGLILLLREHRPSFLRPGLRLYAYVTTADGGITVSTSSSSKPFRTCTSARAFPDCASIPRAPKSLASVAPAATSGFSTPHQPGHRAHSRGPLPYAVDFSRDGKWLYTTTSGNDTLLALDAQSHAIVARAATGHETRPRPRHAGREIHPCGESPRRLARHS